MVRATPQGAVAASLPRFAADGLDFTVAAPGDEPAIRALLRSGPIPGWVTLAYEREPDYFLGAGIEGDMHQAVIAREAKTGHVVGLFSGSERDAFLNGRVQRLGYLGMLRVDPAYRGQLRRLRHGYEACRRLLHARGAAPFYLTSIIAANTRARRLLTAGLPGLPIYRELCGFSTFVLGTSRSGRERAAPRVRRAMPADLAVVVALLQRNYRRYQCAPYWDEPALRSAERCRGLAAGDFLIAETGGGPVGCVALWDQRAFKQHVVRGYDPRLARWRRMVNLFAPATGLPRLPPVGTPLSQIYLSHLAVDGDQPEVFSSLLQAARQEAARRGGESLLIGLSDRHPLRKRLGREFRRLEYQSLLYLVHWEDGAEAAAALDDRPVHVELATL